MKNMLLPTRLPSKTEVVLMLILAKHTISFKMQGFLSIRCSALGKNDIPCQSKLLFPLVHACFQDMQQRSKHHSEYGATGQH
jgi:hypothetical protein